MRENRLKEIKRCIVTRSCTKVFGLRSVINGKFKIFFSDRILTRGIILTVMVYWKQVKGLELEKLFKAF